MTVLNLAGKFIQPIAGIIAQDGQTIDAAVSINDPVFFDDASATWKKSDSTTIVPQGVFQGSGTVILRGLLTTTGLTPGSFYFMDSLGGLTVSKTDIFIGFAKGATELLVDIDIKNIRNPLTAIAGYFLGGLLSDNSTASTAVQRLDYATRAVSSLSALPNTRWGSIGFASLIEGVLCGGGSNGSASTVFNTISVMPFANEVLADIASVLSINRWIAPSNIQSNNAGYLISGRSTSTGFTQTIDKIPFTTKISGILVAIPNKGDEQAGLRSSVDGYAAAGQTFPSIPSLNTKIITKIAFSTETTTVNLQTAISHRSAYGLSSAVAGYIVGDANSGSLIVEKLLFSGNVVSSLTNQLSGSKDSGGSGNALTEGFCFSGRTPTIGSTQISVFDYTSEVLTVLSQTAITSVQRPGSFSNVS